MTLPRTAGTRGGADVPAGRPAMALVRRVPLLRHTLPRHLLLALLAGAFLLVLSELFDPARDLDLADVAYYFCAVAGLTVLMGVNGQISLGHGALIMTGAYATALLMNRAGWPLAAALAGATVITLLIGALVGAAAARLRGPYLAAATLAFAVGLPALATRFPGAFGGDNGLQVSSLTQLEGSQREQAWIACGVALLAAFLLANLVRSGVGRGFAAVRDDEVAAAVCGLGVARTQIVAFVVSAACAGLGGGLYLMINAGVGPEGFTLALSLSILTAAILGGLGSLLGAAWGSIVLVLVGTTSAPGSLANDVTNHLSLSGNVHSYLPLAVYGVVLIVVMVLAPDGIQGGLVRLGRLMASTLLRAGLRQRLVAIGAAALLVGLFVLLAVLVGIGTALLVAGLAWFFSVVVRRAGVVPGIARWAGGRAGRT